MDEEADPENVNNVLIQEFSALYSILNSQPYVIIEKLYQMVPVNAVTGIKHLDSSGEALRESIKTMLEYFTVASAEECCHFLQTVCMLCENIPLHLETRLMSVAWHGNNVLRSSGPKVKEEKSSSSHSECQLIKRRRIDYWQEYICAVTSLLQRRWKQLSEHLVCEVSLENVWVIPRVMSRAKERPDQTPGSAGKGSKADPEGDFGSVEPRIPLETFLKGCAGKVTTLIGPSGSGKTLLLSCLGQQWAHRLGPIPPFFLFVLLEFRQLNLISHSLSLSELLFQHYLPPTGSNAEKRAIMDYLLSNPEESCWVLDGYDEFNSKLTRHKAKSELLDPEKSLSVPELMSGLLNRQLLPGCTVLTTCRAPCWDLEGLSDKVGHLAGWESQDIKEYVHSFFQVKADAAYQEFGMQAADLLLSTRHLLAMSALPALCNICCICLEHLLLHAKDTEMVQMSEEIESHPRTTNRKDGVEQMPKEGGEKQEHGEGRRGASEVRVDGRSRHLPIHSQVPSTLTQVYLTVLGSFLRCESTGSKRQDIPKTMTLQISTVCTLSQYGSEVRELSQLAWEGVESNKTLFMEEEISQDVLQVAVSTGILSKVEVRRDDSTLVNFYCFTQQTLQEFLAALRIMTSQRVSNDQLKRRFNLKTRWTTKSDQKTLFDSLQLFLCGLAAPHCTSALVEIARTSSEVQYWVKKRQDLVLQLLNKLCHKNTLTGPKMLELCHCIQESQDHQLAQQFVATRPTLELRNIRLLPNDIDAVAFVVNSVGDKGVGLDFGACSMELECLDVLRRCQNIQHLCFQSRKYGDKFAEKLSTILPEFKMLKKLEFFGASLTAAGAASLASALQKCPHISEINLSNNNLKDDGIQHIADVFFTKRSTLDSVTLGQNNSSLKAVEYLIGKISSCLNVQDIHVDGVKTLKVTFSQSSDANHHNPTISLLNQKWNKSELKSIAMSLAKCPLLSVLNLSGCQWDVETLRTLTQFVPRFNITKNITLNNSHFSVDSLVILTQLLSECAAVKELHIRLQSPVQVTLQFSEGKETQSAENSKVLSLSCCGLQPDDFENILKSLGSSSDITLLDVSGNHLNSEGLKKLLEFLSHLSGIQKINVSNNSICMEGVVLLAGALCSYDNLSQVHISNGGKELLMLQFCPYKSCEKEQLKIFRINKSNLKPSNIAAICSRLVKSCSHLELDFSHCSLTDEAIKKLCRFLSKMELLQKLNVSHSITSTAGALMLVNCLTDNQRITSIKLRPCTESYIHFDNGKTTHVSCRMTHFSLSREHMERLIDILLRTPHLSDLDLSSNQLEDEGLKCFLDALPELKITRCVNLSNNGLTLRGLLNVANTLSTCENVCAVDISLKEESRCLIWISQHEDCEKSLRITESSLEDCHLVGLAETVPVCPRLTEVAFQNNLLQADLIEHFVKLLDSTDRALTVSFDERWIQSEEAVRIVCRCLEINRRIHSVRVHCTTLQLSFVKASRQTSVWDGSSAQTPSMLTEKIGLVDCAVEGHQLVAMTNIIQKCPALTEFTFLTHNSLGPEGAEFLCSVVLTLPNLTSLSVASKVTCLDDRLAEAFLRATTIQCLNLSGHMIGHTAAWIMSRMFPRLRSLTLSHCVLLETAGLLLIKALEECVSLEGLCLDTFLLDEKSMVCLAQSLRNLNSLRRLRLCNITTAVGHLEANSVLPILAAMERFTNMEAIELEGWRMGDAETEQLTSMLPACTGLKRISLSNNRISDHSGDQLLRTLKGCVYLEELHVSSNSLGDVTAATMALVLPSLTHITVLDLSENRIGYGGSVNLSKAIMCLKNLTKLLLTSVGTSELCTVAANLAHCPLIQDVGLGWNNCGDKVAVALAKVMPLCQKLTRIDLESNNVSVVGVEALVKALQACPALQLIRLWKNQVSSSDASRLSLLDLRLNFSPI